MDGKVDVVMKANTQGFEVGETVNCTPLRAIRWCDIMGIAERKTDGRIARQKKERKQTEAE